jgi:hypothetical protein
MGMGMLRHDNSIVVLNGAEGDLIKVNGDDFRSIEDIIVVAAFGTINTSPVNLRSEPSVHSEIVTRLKEGDRLLATEHNAGWYTVTFTDGDEQFSGFVHEDFLEGIFLIFLRIEENFAFVISHNGINLRQSPSTQSPIIASLFRNTKLNIIDEDGEWFRVICNINGEGYVHSDLIRLADEECPLVDQIIDFARANLGTPYIFGGANLNRGVDCSGFVSQVFKHFGITLNRSSSSMTAHGSTVARSNLIAGDLVFFDTTSALSGRISHVGIYIGGGRFIHSETRKGVVISSLSEAYYNKRYVTARRVLN